MAHAGTAQRVFNLAAGVGHHADWHTRGEQSRKCLHRFGDRPAPQVGAASSIQQLRTVGNFIVVNPNGTNIGRVVVAPIPFARTSMRLGRHTAIVSSDMIADLKGAAERRKQGRKHRWIGNHEDAASVEQDRVKYRIEFCHPCTIPSMTEPV